MKEAQEYVNFYLDKFREGEDIYFGLMESPFDLVPTLVECFKTETDVKLRKQILEIIWQKGSQNVEGAIGKPKVISILEYALHESDQDVWKEALDGLVALASAESLSVLLRSRNRTFAKPKEAEYFQKWIEEAIEQVNESLK